MPQATKSKKQTKSAPKKKAQRSTGTKAGRRRKKALKYIEAVGRRKTSVARVRIWADEGNKITVNEKDYREFFPTEELATVANAPLRKIKMLETFTVSVVAKGGGIRGQAEATRHGIARALVEYEPEFRLRLKKSGYLKRDPRKKERKKYGLRKARRAPQWSKR